MLLDEVRFGWKCFGWENKERRGMVTRGLEWLYFYWGAGTLTWHIPQTIHIGLGEYDNTHVHIAWKNKEIPRVGDERFRMTLHFLVLLRDRHVDTYLKQYTLAWVNMTIHMYRVWHCSANTGHSLCQSLRDHSPHRWELDRPESQKGKVSNPSFPQEWIPQPSWIGRWDYPERLHFWNVRKCHKERWTLLHRRLCNGNSW